MEIKKAGSSGLIGTQTRTATGTVTLLNTDPQYQFINPGGANRTVNLPTGSKGLAFCVRHIGSANTLTVVGGATTYATLTTLEPTCTVVHDGTSWYAL